MQVSQYTTSADTQTCELPQDFLSSCNQDTDYWKVKVACIALLPLAVGKICWRIILLIWIVYPEQLFHKMGRKRQTKAKETKSAQSSSPYWWNYLKEKTGRLKIYFGQSRQHWRSSKLPRKLLEWGAGRKMFRHVKDAIAEEHQNNCLRLQVWVLPWGQLDGIFPPFNTESSKNKSWLFKELTTLGSSQPQESIRSSHPTSTSRCTASHVLR